ncbi:hypothetical protein ACQUQU_12635 [Thalassolituus sp. LLYu03]|uniref:hypothetical protein n=1 Tax=Thalassolituus sp. LLYu03 TaxID=3421656 RepID=UPI003D29DD00
MLLQNTSDLITQVTRESLANGQAVDAAQLINGTVLVIGADALALYRTCEQIADPLGNGLIRSVALPQPLLADDGRFLVEHKAGYVGLAGGRVLLITLNDVQLFDSKNDALRNQNERVRMSLAF